MLFFIACNNRGQYSSERCSIVELCIRNFSSIRGFEFAFE